MLPSRFDSVVKCQVHSYLSEWILIAVILKYGISFSANNVVFTYPAPPHILMYILPLREAIPHLYLTLRYTYPTCILTLEYTRPKGELGERFGDQPPFLGNFQLARVF